MLWSWNPETPDAQALHKLPASGGSQRLVLPWSVESLELAERKGSLALHRFDARLDRKALRANLAILTKRYLGVRTSGEIVEGQENELWCLFEFQRPGSRDREIGRESVREDAAPFGTLPYGIGGFNLRFVTEGVTLSVIVSGFFGLGYVPSDFSVVPLRLVREALGLRHPELVLGPFQADSIYEWKLPIYLPALVLLARSSNHNAVVKLGAALGSAKISIDSVLIRDFETVRVLAPGDEAALAANNLPLEQGILAQMPVEVLEARERTSRYRDIDQTLLSGKHSRALEILASALERDPTSLYLRRRLALMGISGKRERLPDNISLSLKVEPDHELFLSYGIANAIDHNDFAGALELLSTLGAKLIGQIPNADQVRAFDVVLPEMLGDAWCRHDSTKAEDCYHRILERRGDVPRILRKLIYLARQANRSDVEVGLLNRLARVERRKSELAKIYLRHAELRRTPVTGRDEALEMALKALRLDRGEGRAAILAAQILVEKGKPDSAIQLLDGLLKDSAAPLTAKTRAQIFAELAQIWEKQLGRKDLAETRYEQSIQYDHADINVLKNLEAIYRERQDFAKLAWLLEIKFDVYESNSFAEPLRTTFEELAILYRGVLARPVRAYELYQRLVANTSTSPDEIDLVLAWRDVTIDWRDLYNRLIVNLPKMARGEPRAQYLCRLAIICREKLQDVSGAQRHYMNALEDGWIDTVGFRFLLENLAAASDHATMIRCYELRSGQVGAVQRRDLLLEMLQIPGVLSDSRRDQVALSAYLLDTSNPSVIHARFRFYQQKDDIEGLRKLVAILFSEESIPTGARTIWIKASIEVAQAFDSESRFALIDELYRRLLESTEDEQTILSEAITALRRSKEPDRMRYFVSRLLHLGFLPPLDDRIILRLLAGHEIDLALYHKIMSTASQRPEIAALHARTAAAIYGKLENQETNTELMLTRLCTLVPCAEDDLVQLSHLVGITSNYAAFARALQKQADFEDEKGRKFRLLDQLAQIYWRKLKDYGRARLTYVLAIKLAPEPSRIKLLLAQIAGDANDAKAERKALTDFLLDSHCFSDILAMTAAVSRLIKLGEDRRLVQRLVIPHIEQAMQQDQTELAGRIAQCLIDNDAASTEVFRVAFRAAVAVRNDARAKFCWWNGLASVSDRDRAKTFMAETRQILEREGRKELLIDCYQEALRKRIGDRLGPKVNREILIQYGALLFDSDSRRDKALEIYVEAYRNDSEDNRTWMPLYFLLLEFGTPLERYRHLTEIITKLELDPRPLKAFPITIESLRAELKELEIELRDAPQAALDPAVADEEAEASAELPVLTGASSSELSQIVDEQHEQSHVSELIELPAVAGEARGFGGVNSVSGSSEGLVGALPRAPVVLTMPSSAVQQKSPTSHPETQALRFKLEEMEPAVLELQPDFGKNTQAASVSPVPSSHSTIAASTTNFDDLSVPVIDLAMNDAPAVLDISMIDPARGDESADLSKIAEIDVGAVVELPVMTPAAGDLGLALELPVLDMPADEGRIPAKEEAASASLSSQQVPETILPVNPGIVTVMETMSPATTELPVVESVATATSLTGSELERTRSILNSSTESRSQGRSTDSSAAFMRLSSSIQNESQQSSQVESPDSGINNRAAGMFVGIDGVQDDVSDWRAAVNKGDFNADLTVRLVTQAFASELEKHLAIQSVALVAGNCDKLSSWHWRVWRKPDEYGYRISASDRYPQELKSQDLESSQLKLVLSMSSILTRCYRDRFTLGHVAKKLEISATGIEKLRKPMDWNSGLLRDVGLHLLDSRIKNRGFKVYNLSGLEREIFFEGYTRSFYLDESYYRSVPSSHLFHRLSEMMWSVYNRYYVALSLDPVNQFLPVMQDLHQSLSTSGFLRLRSRLSSKSRFASVFARSDLREVKALYEKTGMIKEEKITQLWDAMTMQLHRLQIAETLDIIGVFESILDKDLLKPGIVRHSEIYDLSPLTKPLIEFVTKLKIS